MARCARYATCLRECCVSTDRFRLDGKHALLVGSTGKLGPIWHRAMLDAGAIVYEIDATKGHDIRDRAQLDRWQLCVPDVLVVNAGIDAPPDTAVDFREVLGVNVLGCANALEVFGLRMAQRGSGSIITIGSLYVSVVPDQRLYDDWRKPPCYGASKAALWSLTRYYAAEWGRCGVRCNMLSPGGVRGAQPATFQLRYAERVPLGRMAEPEDLAGPLLFLASDVSRYVTGINLQVDGGYNLC